MKKIMIMMLIGAMLLSSISFAAEANDVSEDNWAYTYVKQAVDNELMPLHDSGAFETKTLSTKMEVLNVIYRMALLKEETTVEEVDGFLEEYQETIDGLLIPQSLVPYGADNHRAIAYALKKDIVKTSELSLFFTNGRFEPISKVDASVYMAKALNVYLEENVNKFYEIRYKDGGEITLMAWPYINLLIEKDVVSEEGDNGYFYPNSVMNRDILAVITSRVLRNLDGYKKAGEGTEEENTFSITGRLSIVHYDKNIIEVRDQYENLKIYDATDAIITSNDRVINLENLEAGMEVNLKAIGNKLVSLNVVEAYQSFETTFTDMGIWIVKPEETFAVLFFGKDSQISYLKTLKSVVVVRDYQKSTLEEIQSGDRVIVHYENGYAKKIESFSKEVVLNGVLERASEFKENDIVSIMLSNNILIEQTIVKDVQKVNISDELLKGDIVKITLENGLITMIEDTGLTTEATGRLVEIKISNLPTISLIDQSGVSKTFSVSKNVKVMNLETIEINGLYALRLDQDITIHLDGLLVDEIDINKAIERTEFESTITEVHYNINIIKAKDADGKEWIISLEGSNQKIGDYKVDDKVYVYGIELSSDLFEADLVIVLD